MDARSLFHVDGLVAAITGGGTAIGLMMAKALVSGGASTVFILGRRKDVLDCAAAEDSSHIIPIVCDITSKESLQAAVDTITKQSGHVNLLVANAGILGPTGRFDGALSISDLRRSLFEDVSMNDFTNTLHVNVTGAYFTMLAFLELLDAGNKNALRGGFGAPVMSSQESGANVASIQSQVIFTSSIGGYSRAGISPPAYSASKSAISHLAKHASTNLSKFEIRVNALAPGLFPSEIARGMTAGRDAGTESYDHRLYIPARRFGGIEDIGGSVLYLASRAGSYCNGLILLVDGGRLSVMLSEY